MKYLMTMIVTRVMRDTGNDDNEGDRNGNGNDDNSKRLQS